MRTRGMLVTFLSKKILNNKIDDLKSYLFQVLIQMKFGWQLMMSIEI